MSDFSNESRPAFILKKMLGVCLIMCTGIFVYESLRCSNWKQHKQTNKHKLVTALTLGFLNWWPQRHCRWDWGSQGNNTERTKVEWTWVVGRENKQANVAVLTLIPPKFSLDFFVMISVPCNCWWLIEVGGGVHYFWLLNGRFYSSYHHVNEGTCHPV